MHLVRSNEANRTSYSTGIYVSIVDTLHINATCFGFHHHVQTHHNFCLAQNFQNGAMQHVVFPHILFIPLTNPGTNIYNNQIPLKSSKYITNDVHSFFIFSPPLSVDYFFVINNTISIYSPIRQPSSLLKTKTYLPPTRIIMSTTPTHTRRGGGAHTSIEKSRIALLEEQLREKDKQLKDHALAIKALTARHDETTQALQQQLATEQDKTWNMLIADSSSSLSPLPPPTVPRSKIQITPRQDLLNENQQLRRIAWYTLCICIPLSLFLLFSSWAITKDDSTLKNKLEECKTSLVAAHFEMLDHRADATRCKEERDDCFDQGRAFYLHNWEADTILRAALRGVASGTWENLLLNETLFGVRYLGGKEGVVAEHVYVPLIADTNDHHAKELEDILIAKDYDDLYSNKKNKKQ